MKNHLVIAVVMMVAGIVLRFNAAAMAPPSSGEHSSSEAPGWDARAAAIKDVGMGCFYLGGLLLVGTLLVPVRKHEDETFPNR